MTGRTGLPIPVKRAAANAHGSSRLLAAAVLGTVGLALLNLPTREIPPTWLLAFTAPAAALALLPRRDFRAFRRALLAATLQLGACFAAFQFAGPLSRPAALACTIVPPMAFVAMRRTTADTTLALFLSFCTLLVGITLRGIDLPLLLGYVAAATVALRAMARIDTLLQVRAPVGNGLAAPGRDPASRTLRLGLLLAAACALVAFAADVALELLPSPTQARRPTATPRPGNTGPRSFGLPDSFVLDGGSILGDLRGEQLVRVRSARDDGEVQADLYLRSGFFALPGLDAWEVGRVDLRRLADDATAQLRRPMPRAPVRWLAIERLAGARNFVFAPPGSIAIRGVADLVGDPAREWFRQAPGSEPAPYEVGYQPLPPPPTELSLDTRASQQDLYGIPPDLDREPFLQLLREWNPRGSALAIAEQIGAQLARRCRYERSDPTGPHPHSLLNFLHGHDPHGYCMHFASATAILLRLAGVPCRIGVGLHGGEPDPLTPGARVYGSQHAHAWVEIPFAGRGFVVFDPTPPAHRGVRPAQAAEATNSGAEPTAGTPADSGASWRNLFELLQQRWLWSLAVLLALAALLVPGRRGRPAAQPLPVDSRTARKMLQALLHELARRGQPRLANQTLEQYVDRLRADARIDPAIPVAFTTYQEVRFGARPFDQARRERLQQAMLAARTLATNGHS